MTTTYHKNYMIADANINSLIDIRSSDTESVLTIYQNGVIATPNGDITIKSWIETIQIMRRLIIDLSQDPELSGKFPYLKDAAHQWMMDGLTGDKKTDKE